MHSDRKNRQSRPPTRPVRKTVETLNCPNTSLISRTQTNTVTVVCQSSHASTFSQNSAARRSSCWKARLYLTVICRKSALLSGRGSLLAHVFVTPTARPKRRPSGMHSAVHNGSSTIVLANVVLQAHDRTSSPHPVSNVKSSDASVKEGLGSGNSVYPSGLLDFQYAAQCLVIPFLCPMPTTATITMRPLQPWTSNVPCSCRSVNVSCNLASSCTIHLSRSSSSTRASEGNECMMFSMYSSKRAGDLSCSTIDSV
mmetsp:Transcript_63858/g.106652  ORF Transcript_63858/g.106652 Transcript_63858/m.106652 type:complete len:255 (-) Transcript_63858:397-1161(-)